MTEKPVFYHAVLPGTETDWGNAKVGRLSGENPLLNAIRENARLRECLLEVHDRLQRWLTLPAGTRREDLQQLVLDALYPPDE